MNAAQSLTAFARFRTPEHARDRWPRYAARGVLYALDPGNGTVRQQLKIGTTPHFAAPTLAGGRAYVGTLDAVVAVNPG